MRNTNTRKCSIFFVSHNVTKSVVFSFSESRQNNFSKENIRTHYTFAASTPFSFLRHMKKSTFEKVQYWKISNDFLTNNQFAIC